MKLAAAILTGVILTAVGPSAPSDQPFRVCGRLTEYFVSDIPSGGVVAVDGSVYRVSAATQFRGQRPLPDVAVGSYVCVEGTMTSDGRLIDFTVIPTTPPATGLPSTETAAPAPPPSTDIALVAAGLLALAAAGLALIRLLRIRG